MIIVAITIIIFGYSAHKNNGFMYRVFDDASKPAEMHISYNMRNFAFKRETYKESSNVRLLVIGNSSARDIINVIRETYDMGKIDLIYRDDMDICLTLKTELGKRLFIESNLVIYAGGDYNLTKENCINKVIEKSNEIPLPKIYNNETNFIHLTVN